MISAVPGLFWLLLLFAVVIAVTISWWFIQRTIGSQLIQKQLELTTTINQLNQLQQAHQDISLQLNQAQTDLYTSRTQLTIAETENRQLTELKQDLYDLQQQNQQLISQLQDNTATLAVARQQLQDWQCRSEEWQQNNTDHQQLQHEFSRLKVEHGRLSTELQQEQKNHLEKLSMLNEARETLVHQFRDLANAILEEKSRKFSEQNQTSLNQLLSPLHERMQLFNQLIHNTYEKETKERTALETELKRLQQLNTQLHHDAKALTQALTGTQNKTQGNWGEMILEKVLENSGLHKGREYVVQASTTIIDDEGRQRRLQPDVLVNLPDHKQIIIDAKMSLTAYVRYTQCDDTETATHALTAHIQSVRQHIKELSAKNYAAIDGLNTLDFVFMFIPVEPAYLLALQQDNQLFDDCFNKRIMLVGPSTLLATLRTIANIWRNERQNQNAQLIAQEGGKLYDKFVVFVNTLDGLGKNLEQAQGQFQKAMTQLTLGRGNLINRAKKLHKLGVQNSKDLPEHYQALEDEETDAVTAASLKVNPTKITAT